MASVNTLEKSFSRDEILSAERIIREKMYHELTVSYDPIHKQYSLSVSFADRDTSSASITVNEEDGRIVHSDCHCSRIRYIGRCAHICVLAILFKNEVLGGKIQPVLNIPEKSDPAIATFLHDVHLAREEDHEGRITLLPMLSFCEDDKNALTVSFRISDGEGHSYVLKNITAFAKSIEDEELKSYSKNLTFVHTLSAFEKKCRPMVVFLLSVSLEKDAVKDRALLDYYSKGITNYSTVTPPSRTLTIKGRYLDAFMEAALPLSCSFSFEKNYVPLHFSHDFPELSTSITKCADGILVELHGPRTIISDACIYAIDETTNTCHILKKDTPVISALFSSLASFAKPRYVSAKDLPAFSRNIYPLLSTKTTYKAVDFDPFDYLPEEARYEIYLDHDGGMIRCTVFAVYPSGKYNISIVQSGEGRRNEEEEKQMAECTKLWFECLYEKKECFVMHDDDDKRLYALIKDGIGTLQQKATVYISDAMKKISILPQPHITIGVSTAGSVLDLRVSADTMSMKDVVSILSHYERKKKFIRLKNGSFMNIDDPEALERLALLKDTLQLKTSDLLNGESSVPAYRAMYLDALKEDEHLSMHKDDHFIQLVRNIKEREFDEYPLPEDLSTIMRPYQKEGVRWLGSLYENGFGALLADEMGLGKTLQVLAFLKVHPEFPKVLVVCPASLVYNWYRETKHFAPDISVRMISGNSEERTNLIQNDTSRLFITSYDLLKNDLEQYKDIAFSCEIIDEAQYIKNPLTKAAIAVKSINSTFRIAMTGTPIENRLSELWSIFDYIMPGFFDSYARFRRIFEIPIVRDADELVAEDLHNMIRPFVLRRLKKDVLKDLPEKIEEVYYADCSGEQSELYIAQATKLRHDIANKSDKELSDKRMEILSALTRLRQIACDPSLLYANYHGSSAKKELCLSLLERAVESGHKVLLFSQFTSMLALLEEELKKRNIAYHLLTGATSQKERADMVKSFQTDDVPVFCISLKAGGTGLNLTAADIVILYDPWWNTAVENQASDRAHRIGQKNIVNIYRLIMKDTIEEKILDMQREKADLAGKLLSDEGIASTAFSKEELLTLLREI